MNENRIMYLATPGGVTEKIVRTLMVERQAGFDRRIAYLKEKGVVNLYGNDGGIVGLVVKAAAIPPGWRINRDASADEGCVVIVPDGRQRATYQALRGELRGLGKLPGYFEFSHRLGFAGFELVGDAVIVNVPVKPPSDPSDEPTPPQFEPADCTRMKLSEYHALKEQHAEKKKGQ